MADLSGLSDEALAVFAFAAYHQLASGQKILSVVRKDGAGHRASAAAADELDGRGLVEAEEREIVFTPGRRRGAGARGRGHSERPKDLTSKMLLSPGSRQRLCLAFAPSVP